MLFKKLFSWFKPTEGDSKFWQRYQGHGDRLLVETDQGRELVMENFLIRIAEDKVDPFALDLLLFQAEKDGKSFAFLLEHEMKPSCALNKAEQTIEFSLRVKKDLRVVIEFVVNNEEFDEAGMFREVLSRAFYQTSHRKSWRECKSEEEILNIIRIKDKKPQAFSAQAMKVREKVAGSERCRFAEVGLFGTTDPEHPAEEPALLCPEAVLVLCSDKAFESKLIVLDASAKPIYSKHINEDLYYYCDEIRQNLVWMDPKDSNLVCYCFSFPTKCSAELRLAMSALLLESKAKMSFQDILAKGGDEWEQFYMKRTESADAEEPEDLERYRKERKNLIMNLEYNALGLPPNQNPLKNIKAFAQAKGHNRAFISAEKAIGLFRFNEDSNRYDFEHNLPVVETFDSKIVHPDKIQLQENDAKMVFLDHKRPDTVYYYDCEKTKVVSEYRPTKDGQVRDVSLFGGKAGALSPNGLILSVSEKELDLIDPRAKGSSVQAKAYKTNPRFNRVLGVSGTHFAVGSATGEVRLYNDFGANSKNLIPSLYGDQIRFMDASRDGRLMLFTFAKYILLLSTQKNQLDGFEYTFKKDAKPMPRLLKIHPSALAKVGVIELNFHSAKFDEKADQAESYIVGISDDVIALWNLSKIMKGHFVTSNVKRTGEPIVEGEFRYNMDDLVTAFADKLTIQHTSKDE